MLLVKVTVNAAFHDCIEANLDNVVSHIIESLCDEMEAEVVFTTSEASKTEPIPDPSFEAIGEDSEPVYEWQEKARQLLLQMNVNHVAVPPDTQESWRP